MLLIPLKNPIKLLYAPVVLAPPPPKASVVEFGILNELYKVAAPSSCPANKTGAALLISTTVILLRFPVNNEVVNRKPPVAIVGNNKITFAVALCVGKAKLALPILAVNVPDE